MSLRAIGAAGAQLPYKQKVTSSNLVSPTIRKPGQKLIRFWLFVYRVTLLDFALILLNVL